MLEMTFTAEDLSRTSLALSPLWEVVASVRVLKEPVAHPLHRRWVDQVRPRLVKGVGQWRLLAGMTPLRARVQPSFICPPPAAPVPDLEAELAVVRRTPPDEVREELDALSGTRSPVIEELYADPVPGLVRLTEDIRAFWDVALAPYWPRIRVVLENDVRYRTHRLAEGGLDALFTDLDPQVGWRDGTLRVAHRHASGVRSLGGRGLLLVPSAFVWPRLFSVTKGPYRPALRYGPRGVGNLWTEGGAQSSEPLAGVLGAARARLLAELGSPASTTELARRTGLTAGGVSQHLSLLRSAGLVSAHRMGRTVLYARTHSAEALLAGAAAGVGTAILGSPP
jgi:DNA-binding transcriptional ArsR family regulator